MEWKPPRCPKCGHQMIEDDDNYGDRQHTAYVCLNLRCDYVHKVRLVRCCDCSNYTFDPSDSIPFHCEKMNRCMSLIHIASPCKGYNQKTGVWIDWHDDYITRTVDELFDYEENLSGEIIRKTSYGAYYIVNITNPMTLEERFKKIREKHKLVLPQIKDSHVKRISFSIDGNYHEYIKYNTDSTFRYIGFDEETPEAKAAFDDFVMAGIITRDGKIYYEHHV
jgi:hypothetical protein